MYFCDEDYEWCSIMSPWLLFHMPISLNSMMTALNYRTVLLEAIGTVDEIACIRIRLSIIADELLDDFIESILRKEIIIKTTARLETSFGDIQTIID